MTGTRRRVRLYHQVRTAHLERAAQLPPATILYGDKRYDFEDGLAAELDLVHARGWRAAWYLFQHDLEALEINEPLYIQAARSTALALLGLRLRRLLGRPRPQVVSYAIENLDPAGLPRPEGWKSALARRVDLTLMGLIWREVDRIAYGTVAAETLYRAVLPTRRVPASAVIPALPAPAQPDVEVSKEPLQVLFLGALSERKGVRQLLAAWPRVRAEQPHAQLTVVGLGALADMVADGSGADTGIELVVDPPRAEIHTWLARAQVLVLPSQPSPVWREQVGLSIVEGLSYGCTIVATEETGLAPWLREHQHQVIDEATSVDDLAAGLLAALRAPLPAQTVLASLPAVDGRLAADRWLFEDQP